jgi:hypothetical protein
MQTAPIWSQLGFSSGTCDLFAIGCGFSGWVLSQYTAPAGDYFITYGVANQDDTVFDSGLAYTATPEPGTLVLLGSGILALVGFVRRKVIG